MSLPGLKSVFHNFITLIGNGENTTTQSKQMSRN